DRGEGRVHVFDTFRTVDLFEGLESLESPAVLPPVLMAAQRAGYPVEIADGFAPLLSVPGREGALVLGRRSGPVVKYSLPLPPLGERAVPKVGHDRTLES